MRIFISNLIVPASFGIAFVLWASPAVAGASVQTAASVDIKESVAVTVVETGPLQLLLRSGQPTMFAVSMEEVPSDGSPASADLVVNTSLVGTASGLLPAMASTGEVLSVSVGGDQPESSQSSLGGPRVVIAQFN